MARHVFTPEEVKRGFEVVESGKATELPAPTYDPNLEFNQGHTWTAKDEKFPPSIIFRRDQEEWVSPSVGWMRQALYDPRVEPNWMLWPNMIGNLGIVAYQEKWENGFDHGTSWYIGYIDVVTGKVHLWEGDESKLQDFADNYPFRGALLSTGEPKLKGINSR